MRVKVTKAPEHATVAKKNKGGDDQLDSDLDPKTGMTDKFTLPNDVSELYDHMDIGYVLEVVG